MASNAWTIVMARIGDVLVVSEPSFTVTYLGYFSPIQRGCCPTRKQTFDSSNYSVIEVCMMIGNKLEQKTVQHIDTSCTLRN